jgi:hypothetical protein
MGLRQGALGGVGQQVMDSSPKTKHAPRGQATRPCPVCGSVPHEVLYQQRFEQFAAGSERFGPGVPLILLYEVANGPD